MNRMPARAAAVAVALILLACEEASPPLAPSPSPASLSTSVDDASMLAVVQTEWRCGVDMMAGCDPEGGWGWTRVTHITTVNADGSNPVNVTGDNKGIDATPAWSPDGMRLAFTRDDEILVVAGSGGTQTNLTRHSAYDGHPAWSPDGARIAFYSNRDGQAELYVMNAADGSNVTRLTNGVGVTGGPDWSRDGVRIAFDCVIDSGNTDICAINVDGSGFVRLTSAPGADGGADWSPVGQIAFGTARYGTGLELAVMNGDGSDVRRVAAGLYGYEPDWSPDGARFAFEGMDQVYVMQVDGTGLVPVIAGISPAWRPVNTPPPVDMPPIASFTYQCSGLTCTLDGRGSIDDRGIVSYAWNLDTGASASGAQVTTTYPAAGPRTVILTVTDVAGQTNSVSRIIDVVAPPDQPPNASFTFTCARTKCTFDGRASTDDLGIASYSWSLGSQPGGTATGAVVTHDYKRSGSYTVTLTVRDTAGQSHVAARTVTVTK